MEHIEEAYEAAKLTGLSILGSIKRELGTLDSIAAWLQLRGMVTIIPEFTQPLDVVNAFSDLLPVYYTDRLI